MTAAPAPLPPDHPLRRARWIWPGPSTYLVNCFAHLRKDFALPAVPRRAPFSITADQHYRLWVNGTYVCRGPARGYQRQWPFDEVDLAPFLRAGANWIAVEAYNPGISTFRYLHQGVGGLLCAGRWGRLALRSDETWLMRRSPAHRVDTDRLSLQLDFQEHVDAARDDRAWIHDPLPPTGWVDDPRHHDPRVPIPFGRPPWEAVEPRGIPLLDERLLTPAQAVGMAHGPCAAGWRTWANVAWPFTAEGRAAVWGAPADAGRAEDGWFAVEVPPGGAEGWSAVCIDAGEHVWASTELEVAGAAGGEVVDLLYQERILGRRGELRDPGTACIVALGARLTAARGTCRHDFCHLLGFRAITAVVRGATRPLRLRLRLRSGLYPFAMRGRFACGDAELDGIFAACRRTQRICAGDAYVDTPWREQAQWWGDAQVQAANTFHLDGDARLLARGIRSLAGQEGPGGLTYGHAPTVAHNCILPDFSLTWVLTLRDHWWQTGDAALVAEQWPRAERVLAYFDTPAARHASGLLAHDRRLWLFQDWSTLWKGGVPTYLNLWYLHTLRSLRPALAAAGLRRQAAALGRRYARHAALVRRLLWDGRRRCWRAGLDAPRGAESVHDQVLDLMLGLHPAEHPRLVQRYLVPFLRDEPLPGAIPSAFWSYHAMLAAASHGLGADCIAFIRRHWGPMLATGTTWEQFTWNESGNESVSHAFTAHPCVLLARILAGIRQTAPGWGAVAIAPTVLPHLERVECLVPSPRGDVASRWERRGGDLHLAVEVPRGVAAEVRLGSRLLRLPAGGSGGLTIAAG